MNIVLSIKPEYAEKIFEGSKKFEFRRAIFKRNDVKKVIVYSSSPVQKVIGEFEIDRIINSNLDSLWDETKSAAGITREYFDNYFSNKETGYAIKVGDIKRYDEPKCLKSDFNLSPPQSFAYIRDSHLVV